MGEGANPYLALARRNVFALKAPDTMATTTAPSPTSAVKVFGTVNLFGYTQAVLQIDGQNFIVREGETRNGVEIVKIESSGIIEVLNRGVKQELSFERIQAHPIPNP